MYNFKNLTLFNFDNINHVLNQTPIIIITSDRPIYLMTCLYQLLSIQGSQKNMITIFSDSKKQIIIDIAQLFEINIVIQTKKCQHKCQVAQV